MEAGKYFVILDGHTAGPFTIAELRNLYLGGSVTGETLYATPDSQEWMPVEIIKPLLAAVVASQPVVATVRAEGPPAPPSVVYMPQPEKGTTSRGVYRVLAFFLGLIGVHNMYAGFIIRGLAQLVFSMTGIRLVLTVPWVIIELFFQSRDGRGLEMV